MNITPHQAKYFAFDLTKRASNGMDRLSVALFDAAVDLNPHQIEAALFALQSPLSKGVILADEVGLGKTIEAAIVLCQFWAERKRRLLVICPASLRKQWATELNEKFNLPTLILDSQSLKEAKKNGRSVFNENTVLIVSMNYANALREEIKRHAWDLVVIDEAHKLRNAYRPNNKLGQGIKWATEDCRKLLLTATPLQNSLLEIYGLSTLIDENLFGDINSFRSKYASNGSNLEDLRQRLNSFCRRTLRNQVTEYVRYTERRAMTTPFRPSDEEHELYQAVSSFLQREDSYALPARQRHLTSLVLRKLLASSSIAIASTLDALRIRLENIREEKIKNDPEFTQTLIDSEDIDDEILDEILAEDDNNTEEKNVAEIDRNKLLEEIAIIKKLSSRARAIGTDTKIRSLLIALDLGFKQMSKTGAARKAIIFTESRRTQDYLRSFLEANGFANQVVTFNGSNNGTDAQEIYERWSKEHTLKDNTMSSRAIDMRTALVDHFKNNASILIATEAASEGMNLQFCSLVINYDLPWNPQRIEQRIGRCHRYGQKHDVVVINFLNERNDADRRVLELLAQKFNLFNGVFGASDEVLGSIESGVEFEKRILAIYQECRTQEEIDEAFQTLQKEMDESIQARMSDTKRTLLENFDEDVHQRLKIQLNDAKSRLDRFSQRFWLLTRYMLKESASFDDNSLCFNLLNTPIASIPIGYYHLISKSSPKATQVIPNDTEINGQFLYRLSHPLGEYVIDTAKIESTPISHILFDVSNHPTRISAVETLKNKSGYLTLTRLVVESFESEEYILFSGFDDNGNSLDQETMEKILSCSAQVKGTATIPNPEYQRLRIESELHTKATVSRSLEQNNSHFNQSREKLEKWADDMVFSAEKALIEIKEQIKSLRRQIRQVATIEEQHSFQQQMQKLENQQRRQRQEIFKIEDEIVAKRDVLIDSLERRLIQSTKNNELFTIRWSIE